MSGPSSPRGNTSGRRNSGLDTSFKHKNLYETLEIEKTATEDDIKRAYRKLALKFHPDKTGGADQEKNAKFQEINFANTILSNPTKRKIYDEYGDMGIKMMDQFGEENIATWILKPWVKWLIGGIAIVTCGFGCCCCGCLCCCQCCCNFCCGKFKPTHPDDDAYNQAASDDGQDEPIISQPQHNTNSPSVNEERVTIVLPPPPTASSAAANKFNGAEKSAAPNSPPPDYGSTAGSGFH